MRFSEYDQAKIVQGDTTQRPATVVRFQKVAAKRGYEPVQSSPGSAGFDLAIPTTVIVEAGTRKLVRLGISVELPVGTYGHILGRSGLAVSKYLDVAPGVVDSDYRGELGIVLINNGPEELVFAVGSRLAQIVIHEIPEISFVESKDGVFQPCQNGFGSSGVTIDWPADRAVDHPLNKRPQVRYRSRC